MHRTDLFPGLAERMVERRGRAHVFDRVEAARTALLVVDMQAFFCAPDTPGAREARDIVPAVNRLSGALRDAGGTVVWIVTTFSEDSARTWSTLFGTFCTPALRARILGELCDGGPGHALWPGLDRQPEDLLVSKDRFSPFVPGVSDLHDRLQARGIDTLLITGTETNVCCETTARHASMLNYRTIMVSDGNAAANDDHHIGALSNVYGFVDVQSSGDIVARLSRDPHPDPPHKGEGISMCASEANRSIAHTMSPPPHPEPRGASRASRRGGEG